MITPKVLHVTTLDISLRFLLFDFLIHLKKQGYDVSAMSAPGPWLKNIEDAGIRHFAVDLRRLINPWRDMTAVGQMVRLFRQEKFDIVHTHTPKSLILGQLACGLARVRRSVATVHGFYFHDQMPGWKRQIFIKLYRQALRSADMVFSQSFEDAATAVRVRICPADKLVPIGNGTDVDLFSPATRGRLREPTRGALGITPGQFVIGAVGRLTYEKGYEELLEAARQLIVFYPQVMFLVIGPDYVISQETLKAHATRLGLRDHFRFLGLRTDMPEMYSAMDLFVLASYREGMPRSLIEACSMGLPVVATNIRGCREIVQDGVNGRLVPARDVKALTKVLKIMIESEDERNRLAAAARQSAVNKHDIRQVWAVQEEHYRRLLEA